jgi:hypothetical protein
MLLTLSLSSTKEAQGVRGSPEVLHGSKKRRNWRSVSSGDRVSKRGYAAGGA